MPPLHPQSTKNVWLLLERETAFYTSVQLKHRVDDLPEVKLRQLLQIKFNDTFPLLVPLIPMSRFERYFPCSNPVTKWFTAL